MSNIVDFRSHLPYAPADPASHAAVPQPLPTDVLVDIAAGLATARPLWEPALDVAPDRRGHVRILATDAYEAWLITWPVGHGVDLHDHGGSTGVIAVAEGSLVEIDALGDGSFTTTRVDAGNTHVVPPERVHDVINTGTAPAISIHVYSPPLTSMTFYDPDGVGEVRTQVVFPEDPALAPSVAAQALHPSRYRALGDA